MEVSPALPSTRYAKSGSVHVAYKVFGESHIDLVYVPGFVSNIETYWEEPSFARWLHKLGGFARVIMFDKRGTGLSDRVERLPTMDQRMDDVRAVMDSAGSQKAAVFGLSEGGALATVFAAHYPERCRALVLWGAFAKFSSSLATPEKREKFFEDIDKNWGTGVRVNLWAPSKKNDPAFWEWFARSERAGASPAAVMDCCT
jgi:pimeloyl-ACP methyl ester carboxylesterase